MALIENVVRRFAQYKSGGAQTTGRGTGLESLAVAQVEQTGFEASRAGLRYGIGVLSGVTGIAPVQALPTTAAQWLLYNSSPTKAVAFDELGVLLVSGTAGAGIVVLGGLVGPGTLPATLPSANAANVKCGLLSSGLPASKTSAVIVASGQTLAAAPTNGWRTIAKCDSANTAILSVAAINAEVNGEIVVPPLHGFALVVTSPAGTTPLYAPHAAWCEFDTDLET